MLTQKGTKLADLLSIVVGSQVFTMAKPSSMAGMVPSVEFSDKLQADVPLLIQQEKRGHKKMEKCLQMLWMQ